MPGTFTNGVLRIIDNDKDFISEDTIVEGLKRLIDDVIQDTKNKKLTQQQMLQKRIITWQEHGKLKTSIRSLGVRVNCGLINGCRTRL